MREEAEVQELEEMVAKRMQRLAELVDEVARRDGYRLSPNLSALERTACALITHPEALRKKKEKREEEEENQVPVWVPGQLLLVTPLRGSRVGVWVLPEEYCGCLGDDFWFSSRIQLRLVRQWIHV